MPTRLDLLYFGPPLETHKELSDAFARVGFSGVLHHAAHQFDGLEAGLTEEGSMERIVASFNKQFQIDAVILAFTQKTLEITSFVRAPFSSGQIEGIPVFCFAIEDVRQDRVFREKLRNPTVEELADVLRCILKSRFERNAAEGQLRVVFDPSLDEQQIVGVLTSMANYFRACGGIGMVAEFENESSEIRDLMHV